MGHLCGVITVMPTFTLQNIPIWVVDYIVILALREPHSKYGGKTMREQLIFHGGKGLVLHMTLFYGL